MEIEIVHEEPDSGCICHGNDQLAQEARELVEEHGPRPEWDHNYRLINMVDRLRMALEASESKLDAVRQFVGGLLPGDPIHEETIKRLREVLK